MADELRNELGDEANPALQLQILDEANKNLKKRKKKKQSKPESEQPAKKKRIMMRSKRPDEVQVPLPSIFYLPEVEVNINHEKIKEDPVDFDLSNLNFPIIFISKKDEKADSLGSKKNKSFEEEKFSKPVQIEKKHGKLKRFDPVGPVQVTPPSKEVVISPVTEIVKVPKTNFA